MRHIDTLVISGGGMKSLATIGSLGVLENLGVLKNITKYAGSSAGSVICVLLAMNLTPEEIRNTVFSQGIGLSNDSPWMVPYNLLFGYGLHSASKLIKYIENLFEIHNFSKNTTFKDLYEKTNKTVVITGTSLNERDTYFFSHTTFPDMKLTDALRISTSIPLYFTCVKYSIKNNAVKTDHRFVDGGLLNNFPLYYFDVCKNSDSCIKKQSDLVKHKETMDKDALHTLEYRDSYKHNTLGIMLINENYKRDVNNFFVGHDSINSVSDYFSSLLNTLLTKVEQDNFSNPLTGVKENFFERTITICVPSDISAIDFSMSKDKQDNLIECGKNACCEFFNI